MRTQFLPRLVPATSAQTHVNMVRRSEASFKLNQAGYRMVSSVFN